MVAYAGQAVLHSLVAAVVVETLLRIWRSRHADERLALRLLVLVLPLILTPVFAVAAPFRGEDSFGSRWMLFSSANWNQLRIAGVGVWTISISILAALGSILCLRDVVGFLVDRVRREPAGADPDLAAAKTSIEHVLAVLSDRMGVDPPSVEMLAVASPVLLCTGVLRPTLVVSLGAVRRLNDSELRAALTHELSHVSHRDTLLGWTLMGLRLLQVFNPVSQIVGRQAIQEIERRADAEVAASGQHDHLASALIKLSGRTDDETPQAPSERLGLSQRVAAKAAIAELDGRCDRLLDEPPRRVGRLAPIRVALAAVGLTTLLFFVV